MPPFWPWSRILAQIVDTIDLDKFAEYTSSRLHYLYHLDSYIFRRFEADNHGDSNDVDMQNSAHQYYIFQCVFELLKFACNARTISIILEDLHWADIGSCDLLRFLTQRSTGLPIHFIGTYRNTDLGTGSPFASLISNLQASPEVSVLRLSGLSPDAIGTLIDELHPDSDHAETVNEIFTRTDGHALFVRAILSEIGQLELPGGFSELSEGIRHLVGRSTAKLSQEQNEIISYAAVLGSTYSVRRLSEILSDHSPSAVIDALDAVVALNLMDPIEQGDIHYQFHHEVIRQTVISDLSLTRRVQIHARCAAQLERIRQTDDLISVEELFKHFAESELINGPEKVAQYALKAGDSAFGSFNLNASAECYQRGLESVGRGNIELFTELNIGMATVERRKFNVFSRVFQQYLTAGIEPLIADGSQILLEKSLRKLDPPFPCGSSVAPLPQRVIPFLDGNTELQLPLMASVFYGLSLDNLPVPDALKTRIDSGLEWAHRNDAQLATRIHGLFGNLCHLRGEFEEQLVHARAMQSILGAKPIQMYA